MDNVTENMRERLAQLLAVPGPLPGARNYAQADAVMTEVSPTLDKLAALIRDLTDPEPCRYDHHGGCQEHGYLSLEDGQRCPHDEAKDVLALLGITLDDDEDIDQ